MNSLEVFVFKNGWWEEVEPKHLNELLVLDLEWLINYKEMASLEFVKLLINKFAEKTFCMQIDYDSLFGNVSWQQPYWFFEDAKKRIIDSQRAVLQGTPIYCLDDSTICVYNFGELRNAKDTDKINIGDMLKNRLKEK